MSRAASRSTSALIGPRPATPTPHPATGQRTCTPETPPGPRTPAGRPGRASRRLPQVLTEGVSGAAIPFGELGRRELGSVAVAGGVARVVGPVVARAQVHDAGDLGRVCLGRVGVG